MPIQIKSKDMHKDRDYEPCEQEVSLPTLFGQQCLLEVVKHSHHQLLPSDDKDKNMHVYQCVLYLPVFDH